MASVAAAAGVAAAEAAVVVAAAAVGMAKAVATEGDRAVEFSIGTEVSRMGVERATRCRSIGRRFLRMVVVVSCRRGEGCGIRPEGRCRVVPILVYMIGCAMRGLACPIYFIGGGEGGHFEVVTFVKYRILVLRVPNIRRPQLWVSENGALLAVH